MFAALLASAWWLDQSDHAPVELGDAPFVLREVSAELGLDFTHQQASLDPRLAGVEPHVAGTGAAVSVCDVNNDGRPDLYVTSSRQGTANALFVQRADGRFEDRADEAGLAHLNEPGSGVSTHSVWADMDNDGDEDLFLAKWGRPRLLRNDSERGVNAALRFTDVSAGSGLPAWTNASGATWFDADHDGRVDLFVPNYFHESHDLWDLDTTEIMQDSFEFSSNGGNNLLFRNLGDGRFEDVTASAGLTSTRWTMAAAAADLDGDGDTDLYCANDYGPEELYLNDGAGHFQLSSESSLADDSKSGMCVALGDVDNSGSFDVYVTNISEPGYLFQGNNLRVNALADGRGFSNIADGVRVLADCGWAWGAQFGDLDNDGLQDLFVANGFVSGDPAPAPDYWYGMGKVAAGTGGLFTDAQNWPAMGTRSLSGFQRSRVLHNLGRDRFVDVAAQVGLSDSFDGRAVALADLSGRGALDVIVANQRGPLLVYRSTPPAENHWIALRLSGSASNRSAIGAELRVLADGRWHTRVVDGGMGFAAQNERRQLVGLGAATSVERVEIRWPSGQVQVLASLDVDREHLITEPEA
ncbi:MAG: hypothetical protein DHS20C15_11370 [Planctomycetota bacterium]|nr:MAG: hypothetical protein DHS20C15_11370 [Planctomycetota bacterium]